MDPARTDAGMGWTWIREGWELFMRSAGVLIAMIIVCIVLSILVGSIPIAGMLVYGLILPVLMAGYMHVARKLDARQEIGIGDLFEGFRDGARLNPLLLLGAIYTTAQLVLLVVAGMAVGGNMMLAMMTDGQMDPDSVAMIGSGMLATTFTAMLLLVTLSTLLSMAFLYAPALVMLDGIAPVESLKLSFRGVLRNIVPLLIFSLIYLLLSFIAMIPMGLGFLVLLPVMVLSIYCSYKSIFHSSGRRSVESSA